MRYIQTCDSPLGQILLASDGEALTGLWLEGQPRRGLSADAEERALPIFDRTRVWLSDYFDGGRPSAPPIHMIGTEFEKKVWSLLLQIPYGETVTYGALARRLGPTMSAQAVGGAVGRNKLSLIIPCHRVIGTDGKLIGYTGGLEKKQFLLTLEGAL
ncbi:MAG: methylated-DNA--[Clostridia bacterium]|nr:methylated-DNA--[protein]-cysteine S-methyltransferase [Clostridia bacterium]